MFSDNLFNLNQLDIIFSSLFTISSSTLGSWWAKRILVSSANKMKCGIEVVQGRSLMYSKKRRGPRIDPCGTPQVTLMD